MKRSKDTFARKQSTDIRGDDESHHDNTVTPNEGDDETSSGAVHHSADSYALMSPKTAAIQARTLAAAIAASKESRSDTMSKGSEQDEPNHGAQAMAEDGNSSANLPDRNEVNRPLAQRRDIASKEISSGASTPSPTGLISPFSPNEQVGLSENWMIDRSAIILGKTIGHSSFGTVNEGRLNGTKVAVKTIRLDKNLSTGDDIEGFKKEAELNCKLRHPNIVLFMGICVQPTEVCIVTELMSRGNVRDLLVVAVNGKAVKLDWSMRLQWAVDTAQGMAYLHSLTPLMIHRDLKTTNLLVDRGMNVKICDFGLSRFKADDKIMSSVGTVQFAAPEVLRHEKYTEKADLFSYGTVLWELHTRKGIFKGLPQIEVYKNVVEGNMPFVTSGIDPRYAKIMRDCWNANPSKRPSFREVLDLLTPIMDEQSPAG
jgi:tRNA A-37 threonylcarbamoyl transferase component Bud32